MALSATYFSLHLWEPSFPLSLLTQFPLPGLEFSGHSPELAKALRTGRIPDAQADEDALAKQFERPEPSRRWREGVMKSSFTYLLLDPRYLEQE